MVDVFEEVEDQIRTERYKALGLKLLPWFIGLAVIALAAALGFWGWTNYQAKQADAAADQYFEALNAASGPTGDVAKSDALMGEVAKSPVKIYRALALMNLARTPLEAGKAAEAAKLLDQAAEATNDPMVSDLARLKSALALLDTAPYKDIEGRLTPLMEEKRPYRLQAREALAFAKIMAGRSAEARTDFAVLTNVLGASDDMRERARQALALIDAGSANSIPAAVKAANALSTAPAPVVAPQAQTRPAQ